MVTNREILYPIQVREMVRKRRVARKRWQRTRNLVDKTAFNKLSKRTSELIKEINLRVRSTITWLTSLRISRMSSGFRFESETSRVVALTSS